MHWGIPVISEQNRSGLGDQLALVSTHLGRLSIDSRPTARNPGLTNYGEIIIIILTKVSRWSCWRRRSMKSVVFSDSVTPDIAAISTAYFWIKNMLCPLKKTSMKSVVFSDSVTPDIAAIFSAYFWIKNMLCPLKKTSMKSVVFSDSVPLLLTRLLNRAASSKGNFKKDTRISVT